MNIDNLKDNTQKRKKPKKEYTKLELILTVIVIIVAIITYFVTYKVSFEDPIAKFKNTFLKLELVIIITTLTITGLAIILIRNKVTLIKILRLISLLAMLSIIILFGVKLHFDNIYNEEMFEKFYEEYEQNSKNINKNEYKVEIKGIGIRLISVKEAYIKESVKGYTNFSMKAIIYMVIELLITILILYLSFKFSSVEEKKEKLKQNDMIFFNKK